MCVECMGIHGCASNEGGGSPHGSLFACPQQSSLHPPEQPNYRVGEDLKVWFNLKLFGALCGADSCHLGQAHMITQMGFKTDFTSLLSVSRAMEITQFKLPSHDFFF